MRKADVERRRIRGESLPAVNVKVQGSITWAILVQVEAESGETGFAAWAQDLFDSGKWPDWTWDSALELGWEQLQADADDVWALTGRKVKVWSDGRSGGWAVVEGLPDVDSWDAIMVARWAKWQRFAKSTAAFVPNEMAMLLAINTYAAERERREKIATASHSAESQVS